ncbi:MAG: hypothetical protein ACPGJV_01810 [Bacteriovoracaceae bacterium]
MTNLRDFLKKHNWGRNQEFPILVILILTMIGLYFLPYNFGSFKIIGPFCLLGFSFNYKNILEKMRSPFHIGLSVFTIVMALMTKEPSFIGTSLIMLMLYFNGLKKIQINSKIAHAFSVLLLLSCAFQLIKTNGAGRPTLFVGDPNFTGMYLILLLWFFFQLKVYYGQGLIIASSTFLLSRAFLYTKVIFYGLALLKRVFKRSLPYRFDVISLLSNLAFIGISLALFDNEAGREKYAEGASRLQLKIDMSVHHRFEIVNFYVAHILENWKDFFLGIPNYEQLFRSHLNQGILHNSILSPIARFGFLGFLPTLYFLQKFFHQIINEFKRGYIIEMLFAWAFMGLFIHGFLETYLILFFIVLLCVERRKS